MQSWLVLQDPSSPARIVGGPQPGQFSVHIKLESVVEKARRTLV
jgi:hypothetical protein